MFRIKDLKQIIYYIALSFLGCIIYLLLHAYLGNIGNLPEIKLLAADSNGYLKVGSWLMGGESPENAWRAVLVRPFGYPIILHICESLGPYALIVVQLVMWLASANLLFYIVTTESSTRDGLIFAVGYLLLFSLPVMSVFALTETTIIFFTTLSIFFFYEYERRGKRIFWAFFYLGVAAVIKPSFLYIFMLGGLMVLIMNRKQLFRFLIPIVLASSPILLQSLTMYKLAGTFSLSLIGERAIEDYWLVRAHAIQEGIDIMESRERAEAAVDNCWNNADLDQIEDYKQCVSAQLSAFAGAHPAALIKAFGISIWDNISAGSNLMQLSQKEQPFLRWITMLQNQLISALGILMSLVVLGFVGLHSIKERRLGMGELLLSLLCINILFQYFIAGLSYFQGDRFSIISYLPIFILGSFVWGRVTHGRLSTTQEKPEPKGQGSPMMSSS